LQKGGKIESSGGKVIVSLPGEDFSVTRHRSGMIEVEVNKKYIGATCGLCGTYTKDVDDDLLLGDGTAFVSRGVAAGTLALRQYKFGRSYAVKSYAVQVFEAPRTCLDDPDPHPTACTIRPQRKLVAVRRCRALSDAAGPLASCFATVDPVEYQKTCLQDVCADTSDSPKCPKSLLAYQQACIAADVTSIGPVEDDCGACFGDGSTCASDFRECRMWSDKNLLTPSGYFSTWNGACDFVFAEDRNAGFEVQLVRDCMSQPTIRYGAKFCDRPYVGAIAVRIGRFTVRLQATEVVLIDGVGQPSLPYTLPNGAVVRKGDKQLSVWLGPVIGGTLSWDLKFDSVSMTFHKDRVGHVAAGLCAIKGPRGPQWFDARVPDYKRMITWAEPYCSSGTSTACGAGACDTGHPTAQPTRLPTLDPTVVNGTHAPTPPPTKQPTLYPTDGADAGDTGDTGDAGTPKPTPYPTTEPTEDGGTGVPPTAGPTVPAGTPTSEPTFEGQPTAKPTTSYDGGDWGTSATGRDSGFDDDDVEPTAQPTTAGDGGVGGDTYEGEMCIASGDPHYTTFDGVNFDWQGQCEYVFAKQCAVETRPKECAVLRADLADAREAMGACASLTRAGKAGGCIEATTAAYLKIMKVLNTNGAISKDKCNVFEVQVQNTQRQNGVSITQGVAVETADVGLLQLGRGSTTSVHTLNGMPLPSLPHSKGDTTIAAIGGGAIQVTVAGAIKAVVKWSAGSTVSVLLQEGSSLRKGNTCGLCGDDNDSPAGESEHTMKYNAWKADPKTSGGALSTLFVPGGKCTEATPKHPPHPCADKSSTKYKQAAAKCEKLSAKAGPYTKCHGTIDPTSAFNSCVFDECGVGNGCPSFSAYEQQCKAAGATGFTSVIDKCGKCFGKGDCGDDDGLGPVCSAHGDPHYFTFDQLAYDWQGQCEYILAKQCSADEKSECAALRGPLHALREKLVQCTGAVLAGVGTPGCVVKTTKDYQDRLTMLANKGCDVFEVHVQNSERAALGYTVTVGVAIQTADGLIRLGQGRNTGVHRLNGMPLPSLPHTVGQTTITGTGGASVTVSVGGDIKTVVAWDGGNGVTVRLREGSSLRNGRTCGLCGDNKRGARGSELAHVGLNDHWKTTEDGPLATLFVPSGKCQEATPVNPPHPCGAVGSAKRKKAEAECEVLRAPAGPYGACHVAVMPTQLFESCVYDACGAPSTRCGSIAAYEEICKALGIGIGSVIDKCGVCFGDGSSCTPGKDDGTGKLCTSHGDPHYTTFEGQGFNYQGECEYVFAKQCTNPRKLHDDCEDLHDGLASLREELAACTASPEEGCIVAATVAYRGRLAHMASLGCDVFEVQTQNTKRPTPGGWTYTQGVAIQTAGAGLIHLIDNTRPKGVNLLNGMPFPTLPYTEGDVDIRRINRHTIEVSIGGLIKTVVTFTGNGPRSFAYARIRDGSILHNNTCGLCGAASGLPAAESRALDLAMVKEHGYWKTTLYGPLSSLFMPGVGKGDCKEAIPAIVPHPCGKAGSAKRKAAEGSCSMLRDPAGPYSACHGSVNPTSSFDSCVYDACGDPNSRCASIQAFESQCAAAGVTGMASVVDECGVCFGDGTSCKPDCPDGKKVCSMIIDTFGPFADCFSKQDPRPFFDACMAQQCAEPQITRRRIGGGPPKIIRTGGPCESVTIYETLCPALASLS
jgi:hypothetical protein